MYGYIDGYDFGEMEAQKYYAPPASWSEQKRKLAILLNSSRMKMEISFYIAEAVA